MGAQPLGGPAGRRAGLLRGWRPSLVGLSVVAGLRGSLGRVPLQTKTAAVTSDRLLNKAVLNPYVALADAASLRWKMAGSSGLKTFLPDGDIRAALRRAFPQAATADDIDHCLQRTAAGPRIVPPRHVFLICMESYDAWPMEDKYAGLDLVPQGRRLAREGLHLRAFLPAGSGTIDSNTAILTGIPYASLHARYEPYGRRALPTSLPAAFRRLGYRTRFFYGGSLSWQNIGDFARDQGFDEVYGAGNLDGQAPANEWGVADQYLFDFVARTRPRRPAELQLHRQHAPITRPTISTCDRWASSCRASRPSWNPSSAATGRRC